VSKDPFTIVEPDVGNQAAASSDEFARGDDWIIKLFAQGYVLSYLTGHFALEEKRLVISKADALSLANGTVKLDKFLLTKQQ
jgi:hypothetical protein